MSSVQERSIAPRADGGQNLGEAHRRWNEVHGKKVVVEEIQADLIEIDEVEAEDVLVKGDLYLLNLPEEDPEVEGVVWIDNGVLKVSEGPAEEPE